MSDAELEQGEQHSLNAHSVVRALYDDRAWARLLEWSNCTNPANNSRLRSSLVSYFERQLANETLCQSFTFSSDHRRRIETSNTMLTDHYLDDFFELLFDSNVRCSLRYCQFMESTLVPVYSGVFATLTRSRWHYNMTNSPELFNVSVDADNRRPNRIKSGVPFELQRREFMLRKFASNIRHSLARRAASSRLIVIPVVHSMHIWLYIVDMERDTIEYYDSLASYMLSPSSRNSVYARRLRDEETEGAARPCVVRTRQELVDYLHRRRCRARGHSGEKRKHCAGDDDQLPVNSMLNKEERREAATRSNRITKHKAPSDVAAFHASLLWFFKVYLNRDMVLVDFWNGRDRQRNETDCGVFTAIYVYLRVLCNEHYNRIINLVEHSHVHAFRHFMTLFSDHAMRGRDT